MRRVFPGIRGLALLLAACGGSAPVSKGTSARQALIQNAELVEFDTPSVRAELFREIARASAVEAGKSVTEPVFFPMIQGGELVGAPALELRSDLLQMVRTEAPLALTFSVRGSDGWSEDPRENLQGLSEREAAELVARWLLAHWGISAPGSIQVDRASGAAYAAAYVDGILKVNPAFLYMASSLGPSSIGAGSQ